MKKQPHGLGYLMMIACVNLRDAKMEPQLKASLSLDTVGDGNINS